MLLRTHFAAAKDAWIDTLEQHDELLDPEQPATSSTRSTMSASRFLLAMGVMTILLSGCGSSTAPAQSTGAVRTADTIQATSASCVGLTAAQQLKAAAVVLVGTMLPGPTTTFEHHRVLLSPARMRVSRYVKGTGPTTVRVQTAVARNHRGFVVSEDGIDPRPGERWKILSDRRHQPLSTSICAGSRRL